MNEYKWDELHVGLTESFQKEVTQEMMRLFLDITGDVNPLHNDSEFAMEMGHPSCVVYGMLTASLISTLGGVYLPGKYCIIQGVEIKFSKPVYVGDVLNVCGVVKEIHDSVGQIIINVSIKNQNGKTVAKGILKVGMLSGR